MVKNQLIPLVSLNIFRLNENIETYTQMKHKYEYEPPNSTGWATYRYPDFDITVYCENNIIECITCYQNCFYNKQNLIGVTIGRCKKILNAEPDSYDFMQVGYDDEKPQTVYEFDKLGLQIWVANQKVVSVSCSSFIEDDPIEGTCPQSV